MNRRSYMSFFWILYPVIWMLWIFVLPRFFPQVSGYGFFVPFIFFFPFFRRRGGRSRPRPTSAPQHTEDGRETQGIQYENMLSDENYKSPYSMRNYIFYAFGAAIIIAGIVLVYLKIF